MMLKILNTNGTDGYGIDEIMHTEQREVRTMNDRERAGLDAMADFGGGFASRLAEAWMRADSTNSAKLRSVFGDLLEEYAKFAEAERARAAVAKAEGR